MIFTPDDFKNKDGEPASPEAAARIANEKLRAWFSGEIICDMMNNNPGASATLEPWPKNYEPE